MVLDRRKIKHGSQEEIGYELGLIVPKNDERFFTKVRTGRKPVAGYGTQIQKDKYSISNYFLKNKINLKETYFPVEKIKDIKSFIRDNLKINDLIVCFSYKKLYGTVEYGHVSLIQNMKGEIVTLVDPWKKGPAERKVKLSDLVRAMKYHGKEKRGGFWLISEFS